MRRRRLALVAFAAGAVTAYLYDPENGPARRENLRHQSQSWTRRVSEAADKRRGYASGQATGPEARPKGSGQFHPESQVDLREHLHQVLAELAFPTTDVNVDVVDGAATLRGQLQSDTEIRAAINAAQGVEGVKRVESYLHLPGMPAPNKAAAQRAT